MTSLARNKYLFDEIRKLKALFFKLAVHTNKYHPLKNALLDADTQSKVLDPRQEYHYAYARNKKQWFANMGQFLDVIHDIYLDIFPNQYVAMAIKINEVRSMVPGPASALVESSAAYDIMLLTEKIISEAEKTMQAFVDNFESTGLAYEKKFDYSLTDDVRVKTGLIEHIKTAKKMPGTKFFISPVEQYLVSNSAAQVSSSCNTTKIRKDIHDELAGTSYAMLVFKR